MRHFTPPTHPLRNFVALAGLALAAGSVLPSFAQKARLPYLDETWMVPYDDSGAKSDLTLSYRTQHFYNAKNQLVRDALYGMDYSTNKLNLTKYTCYDYDEQGRLAVSYTRTASFDSESGSVTFKAPKDSVVYAYNEAGQLVKKTLQRSYSTYTYDTDGNLYQESVFDSRSGQCTYVLTYTGYSAEGCPALITTHSDLYDYYNCKEAYTYNAFNKPLTYEKFTETVADASAGDPAGVVKNVSESINWVYDDEGNLLGKAHYTTDPFSANGLTPQDSVGYTIMADNQDCTLSKNYSYDNATHTWMENTITGIAYQYVKEYDGNFSVPLTVKKVEDTVNDNGVSFKIPDFALFSSYAFHIYKDGQLLKECLVSDVGAVDPQTMTYTYVDKQVTSGLHDYFVQTVRLNEMQEPEEFMNASNVVVLNRILDLPTVQNLRLEDWARDREKGYVVKVAWDSPENAEAYDFQRYNIYLGKYVRVPDNKNEDGQAPSYDVAMSTKTSTQLCRVACQYPYGTSDEMTIDLYMKDIIAGITQTVSSDVSTAYENHILRFSAPVNAKVFNMAGQMVKAENNVNGISFETESAGSYAVLIEKEGHISVVKVQR